VVVAMMGRWAARREVGKALARLRWCGLRVRSWRERDIRSAMQFRWDGIGVKGMNELGCTNESSEVQRLQHASWLGQSRACSEKQWGQPLETAHRVGCWGLKLDGPYAFKELHAASTVCILFIPPIPSTAPFPSMEPIPKPK